MKSWMPLEHMTVPRSSAAACAFNGQLWVLGGTSGSRLRSVERYDPRAGKWESGADLIEIRSTARSCCCLDRLYVGHKVVVDLSLRPMEAPIRIRGCTAAWKPTILRPIF